MIPPPADRPPPRAWLIVGLLWVVGCLNYVDRVMLITMRLSVKDAIPMSEAQFGLLTTVFLLVYALLSPVGGYLADRLSCSRTIIFSLVAWSSMTWLTGHATTFDQLLLCRALMGVSEACYLPAAGALIAAYHGNATRSLANGIHLSGIIVGSGLGGLGGWLAEQHTWTFAFDVFGIAGLAYTGVLLALLRDPSAPNGATPRAPTADSPRTAGSVSDALRSLFSRSDFFIALFFWALLSITTWAFAGWIPAYLHDHFHRPEGEAGLIGTLSINGGLLVGMIVAGAWADRWARTNPEGRAWVGIIGLGVCAPCVFLVASTGGLGFATMGLILFGFTRAFPDVNMMPLLFQITDIRYRATGLGLLNAFGTIAGGVTIYIGGALRDAHVSITHVFHAGAIGLLLCAGLLWIIRPRSLGPR